MPNYIKLGNLRIEIPEPANNGGGGGGGGSSSLTNGLLAFYNLSDLTDASGNGNTLTNNGDVTFSSGKIGNAATFNGNNYLNNSLFNYNASTDWTISLWLNVNQLGGAQVFSLANALDIYIGNAGGYGIVINNAQADNSSSIRLVNFGSWYHYVATKYNGLTKTYLDNISATPSTQQNFGIGSNLGIATYDSGQINGIDGQIDAVGFWNRALSDAEITELYNAGAGKEHPFS
jgi:hypothetical protein